MHESTTSPQSSEATHANPCNALRDNATELALFTPGPAPTAPLETCQPLVDISTGDPGAPIAAGRADSPSGFCHLINDKTAGPDTAVLELRVRNHPGTMSHVTGLFSRRGFNLEAIVCVPVADGATSCMLLLVADEPRLEQVERQLAKLYDVLTVRHRRDLTREFFTCLAPLEL